MNRYQQANNLMKCEDDPVHYIWTHVLTWDEETKSIRPFASGYPLAYQNKMQQLVRDIIAIIRLGRTGILKPDWHILKSRQTGATWLISAILSYCFLFIENFSAILTSQSDNKLDNSNYVDYNTFMGKVNFIVNHLPPYLQPDPKDILRSNKSFQYLLLNSSIKADSGISPARSAQVSLHCGDEWAEQEFDNLKLSSLREAVKGPNILFSTPNGQDNSFYRIYKQGIENPEESSFRFETFHWKEKMDESQWAEFKARKLREYNGDIGMFNRNLELSFESLVTGTRTFEMFKEEVHVINTLTPALQAEIAAANFTLWQDYGFYAPSILIAHTATAGSIVLGTSLGLGRHPDLHAQDIIKLLQQWKAPLTHTKIFGDPSGVSNPREQTGASSFDLYSKALGRQRIFPAINKVIEGIQQTNAAFFNNKLFILAENKDLIKGLKIATYPTDDAGRPLADKYLLDHPYIDVLDCLRYASHHVMRTKPTETQLQDQDFM